MHPPLRHRRGGASVQGLERLLVGAVVAEGQHRQVRPGQHRVERAVQHGERGPEGAAARRALVAVRVGEVGREQVAVLQDLRRDVGVEVERGGDRHGRPDRPAQVADQRAFRVVEGGRQHAAVQRQDHRVEAAPARGLEHEAVHLVEHGVLHRAAGLGAEQRRHDHFHAGLRRRVHDAAERRIGAAGARHGVLAGADDEALAPGQDRVETVGFLRDAAGQDASHRHGHLATGPGAVSPRGGRLCRSGAASSPCRPIGNSGGLGSGSRFLMLEVLNANRGGAGSPARAGPWRSTRESRTPRAPPPRARRGSAPPSAAGSASASAYRRRRP